MVPEEARTWCNPVTALLAGQPHEELIKYAVVNDIDLVCSEFEATVLWKLSL